MRKVWFVLLVCVAMVGCRTLPTPPVVMVERDTIYQSRVERDSVFVSDSVLIREKGDTVWVTRNRYLFRDVLRHDTIYIARNDTITNEVEVEKALTWWERVKMEIGGVALVGFAALAVWGVVKLKIKS